ncbi:ABC transporter ATP-binding protein [Patescibacteria group bacterium]|nr:ABC transporter ATP-binding protein [Patescibacteria group bacterium]
MIEVRDLQKAYHDEGGSTNALRGVNFSIDKGEFVSIMGPSGSGKSTLLHILSFLDRPTGGSYRFQGRGIDEMSDLELAHVRNKDMGFVFQAFNLLSRLTVYENVEIPLLYADGAPAQRRARIEEAVRSVGLEEKIHMEAGKLSGGQKQRVAIARALVTDPNVIFADEPTGNLDSQSGLQVMEILDALHKKGRTIILVTHETQTAEFANRIIRIKDGLVESDAPVAAKHMHNAPLK